ncbi:MAG: hypothetical protein COA96_01350 [SAR86 cluster bacterium]|uniref:Abasic site processing protein n=1 Tax=SAR86 cluster bacterium TaxID=2030880 RepID=A0A2A5B9E8_9GAMM|nr:MAG: hypothetical protein COA96_01350 [SAR86 cluster bacterium]
MCGRFHLLKDHKSEELARELGIDAQLMRYSPDIAPGAPISIIHNQAGSRRVNTAIWWLKLDAKTLKPDRNWRSYNSNWKKLHVKGSLAYTPYRQSRCLIPASAFYEGLGGTSKVYHQIELEGQAIVFGGLYNEYNVEEQGYGIYSASIITLAGLPDWESIHRTSMPLMLPANDKALINQWLDPSTNIEQFAPYLTPAIRQTQKITPIGKPSLWNKIGHSFLLEAS